MYGANLISLIAPNCGLSEIELLHTPEQLYFVDISGNHLSDAALLNKVGYGAIVVACDNQFTDLSGVSPANFVRAFFLNGNKISELPNVQLQFDLYFDYNSQYEEQELEYMARKYNKFIVNNVPLDKRVLFERTAGSYYITFDEDRTKSDSKIEEYAVKAKADELYYILYDDIFPFA